VKPDLKSEAFDRLKDKYLDALDPDERAAIEVATGEMGNMSEAVKLGWLRMRTKEHWTKQRFSRTVSRAIEKIRRMVESGPIER